MKKDIFSFVFSQSVFELIMYIQLHCAHLAIIYIIFILFFNKKNSCTTYFKSIFEKLRTRLSLYVDFVTHKI